MDRKAYFGRTAMLPQGWGSNVRVIETDGVIESVGSDCQPEPGDIMANTLVPKLCNLHSHAFQYAMRGDAEFAGPGEDTFWTWRDTMYDLALTLDPDAFGAIALAAFRRMVASGFSHVCEFHYLHNDPNGAPYANPAEMGLRLLAAADEAGIGITLLPALYAHAGFGGQPLGDAQRRFGLSLDAYARIFETLAARADAYPNARVGLCAHSLRAVTPDELQHLTTIAPNAPVHIHIAEQVAEVEACVATLGARPVEWLMDAADVNDRWCLVHATHVTETEARQIATSGAVVGLCPITEANLGDGLFPARRFQELGGRYGVGSDSNIEISAAGELRLLEYGQRLFERKRNVLAGTAGSFTAETIYRRALDGGGRAGGLTCVGIRPGSHSGLLALDGTSVGPAALSRHIFAPSPAN